MGWELEDVEKPFVAQLQGVGWTHIEGSIDDPAVTGRGSFAEVVQEAVLRERLRAINLRDGEPWLDDERLEAARESLEADPNVRALKDMFGAELNPDSIELVDDGRQGRRKG